MAGFDPDVFGGTTESAGFDPEVFSLSGRKTSQPTQPAPVNRAYQDGRSAEGWKQGLASVANGPLLGFADEIGGAVGAVIDQLKPRTLSDLIAPKTFGDRYRENRDALRGMQDQQREDNPWTTGVTQAMASAPTMLLSPANMAARVAPSVFGRSILPSGVIGNAGRAAAAGAGYGAVAGAGNSTAETIGGVVEDAGSGALTGAAVGGGSSPIIAGMGAGGRNVMNRLSDTSAAAYAREKIAEAFARDARGKTVVSGRSDPAQQASARLAKLGPEAALVDSGGRNTLQLLDTMATLPGRTQEAAAQFQRQRASTSGTRMRAAADDALGTGGQRLATTLESLDAQRSAAAKPLYDQVRAMSVHADDDLVSMVSAAEKLGALTEARKMATAAREQLTVDPANPGVWAMRDLDHIKRGLDALVETNTTAVGKTTAVGRAIDQLRQQYVTKLDDMTTSAQTGQSVYKAARDAYAGPSQLMDAAQAGKKAIAQDEAGIAAAMRGLSSASEQEAFRIGAFEGLRAKLGTQSGRTNVMNMWQEQTTREKLRPIFGTERAFREFASEVAKEATLKRVQGVNQGSQTARRIAAMGDLDVGALPQVASAVAGAKAGNPLAVIGPAAAAWNRVATPQSVRDEIGRLLMLRGPQAQQTMGELGGLMAQLNRNNGILSDSLGLTGGLIGGNLAPMGLLGR